MSSSKKKGGGNAPTPKANPSATSEPSFYDCWPKAVVSRDLFVAGIRPIDQVVLEDKGYNVVDVLQLKRTNDAEHQYAIEGWLQGMSEGSIPMDKEKRLSIELEARARGLLVNRSMKVDVKVNVGKQTMDELLNTRASRFTLNGASLRQIERAAKAATEPGFDLNESDEKEEKKEKKEKPS